MGTQEIYINNPKILSLKALKPKMRLSMVWAGVCAFVLFFELRAFRLWACAMAYCTAVAIIIVEIK